MPNRTMIPAAARGESPWSTTIRAFAQKAKPHVDRCLKDAGVAFQHRMVLNYLNTQIAMVEAGEGIAVIPSFAATACRGRKVVVRQLTSPAVYADFFQIRNRGKKLPPGAEDFTLSLKIYIAKWTGRAGVQ